MTSVQLKEFLDRAFYLKLWIKEVETYAEKRLNDGFKIQGYGLKAKRAQRVWRDVRRLAGVSFKYGIKTLKTEVLSVAEVEKEMKAKKISREEIEEFLKANVVSISSGTTLAKTEDDYAERDLESLFGEL